MNNWNDAVVSYLEKDWYKRSSEITLDSFEIASTFGNSFLDIGCGIGRFYEYLKKNRKEKFTYIGIDSSEAMIKRAKKKFPEMSHWFLLHNALSPLVLIEGVDVVLCNELFIHLRPEDQKKILYNLNDVVCENIFITIQAKDDGDSSIEVVKLKGQEFYNVIQNVDFFIDTIHSTMGNIHFVVKGMKKYITKDIYRMEVQIVRKQDGE